MIVARGILPVGSHRAQEIHDQRSGVDPYRVLRRDPRRAEISDRWDSNSHATRMQVLEKQGVSNIKTIMSFYRRVTCSTYPQSQALPRNVCLAHQVQTEYTASMDGQRR